ncbi:MAG: carboxylating nicotinate-nucleotide diphosphorylase [Sediminibacterium sp.]|jgi:nicotinate-nucleotide pyrophosphorylase (carboxylating)
MQTTQELLDQLIIAGLKEDIGNGDYSTLSCIDSAAMGKAVLMIKQDGVLAGMKVAERIFQILTPTTIFKAFKADADTMKKGEIAFEVHAPIHAILSAERLVLNCMQRMSGIATLTKKYTNLLQGYHTQILDTRKTTPNFRLLEKAAVKIGGGVNHRFALYDMIMLKDNHIDYCGGLEMAINKAFNYVSTNNLPLKIEVETRTLADVEKVCAIGKGKVFRIMLDNFLPIDLAIAVKIIGTDFETEASGGINLENIQDYANTGVDYVSVGALIHQAQSVDLSLKASFN